MSKDEIWLGDEDPSIDVFLEPQREFPLPRRYPHAYDTAAQLRPVVPATVTLEPRDRSYQRQIWRVYPQGIFRGDGLWLWGSDETTRIHRVMVGSRSCLELSDHPIPGLFFEAGMSFGQFEELLVTPRESWKYERLKRLPVVPPHQRILMRTVEIGMHILLDVEGPLEHAVVWGLGLA